MKPAPARWVGTWGISTHSHGRPGFGLLTTRQAVSTDHARRRMEIDVNSVVLATHVYAALRERFFIGNAPRESALPRWPGVPDLLCIDGGFMLFFNLRKVRMSNRQVSSNVFPQSGLVLCRRIDCYDDCGRFSTSILAWRPTVSPIRGTAYWIAGRYSLQRQLDLHSRQHEVALEDRMMELRLAKRRSARQVSPRNSSH